MSIRQALAIINDMEAAGVIGRYAIGGAVAAFNYIEPAVTQDLDIFVSFEAASSGSGIVTLTPIIEFLAAKGFDRFVKEGIVIAGWPVQFLPVASALDEEALTQAKEIDIVIGEGTIRTRVLQPHHLAAIALAVGRPKDWVRVLQFLDEDAIDLGMFAQTLEKHALLDKWRVFCTGTGRAIHLPASK